MQYSAYDMNTLEILDSLTLAASALSDPVRLRIVALLQHAGKDLCVCEFVDALEVPQYQVSRNLKLLESAGLVRSRPEGKWVYYDLPSEPDEFRRLLLRAAAALPDKIIAKDARELRLRLKLREDGKCLSGVRKTRLLSRRP
jgi:ArsR family transcriptional regulator, arsenate/arsenite/antimonite-responsive transcriptional repressor